MALPSTSDSSSTELSEPTKLHLAIVEALQKGMTTGDIARKLAKGDKAKAKKYRAKLRTMMSNDPVLRMAIIQQSENNLVGGLPGATAAAVRRAHRGRMDAVKFVSESTGFHNPRVKHEHSGEIKIKLDMPRPSFVDTESVADDQIADADVVEDGHPDET